MNAVLNNPRKSAIGVMVDGERMWLAPGETEMAVAKVQALLKTPIAKGARDDRPRPKMVGGRRVGPIPTFGAWLKAQGVTVAWPEPEASPSPDAEEAAPAPARRGR